MIELVRRVVLLVCVLLATTLSLWTPGAVIRVSVVGEPAIAGIDTRDPRLGQLADVMESVVSHTSKDPAMRERLGEGQISMLDSTLAYAPSRFEFYFGSGEAPWESIVGQLQAEQGRIIAVGTAAKTIFLRATLCMKPRETIAPEALVYPWSRSAVPGWLVVAGIGAYVVGHFLVGRKNVVELDPRLGFSQTALGVMLAVGFWSAVLMRCDPSPAIFTNPGWGNMVAMAGAAGGVVMVLCGGVRACRRLEICKDHVVISGLAGRMSVFPAQVTGMVKDRARRVFEVSHSAGEPLLIPIRQHAAARAVRLLGGDTSMLSVKAGGVGRGILSWGMRRVVPALVVVTALGAMVGFFRAGTAFMAGLQGLIAGMVVGAIAGYWARWDRPQDYGYGRQFGAAVLAVGAFMVGQLGGISLALVTGTGWEWLVGMLTGHAHEQVLGYRRYTWGMSEFRPGPVGWVLLNGLDVMFLFVFAWLMLGVNLARERGAGVGDAKPAEEERVGR